MSEVEAKKAELESLRSTLKPVALIGFVSASLSAVSALVGILPGPARLGVMAVMFLCVIVMVPLSMKQTRLMKEIEELGG